MADSEEKIMRGAENCKDIHISFLSLLYAGHDFYAIITIFITEKEKKRVPLANLTANSLFPV